MSKDLKLVLIQRAILIVLVAIAVFTMPLWLT